MLEAVIAICVILGIITLTLVAKIVIMKKALREITAQMKEKTAADADTNTLIDISSIDKDMRNLAAELNVSLEQLRREQLTYVRGDTELKNAITNISHDLRTPLTAICGYLDLLKKREVSDEVRGYLEQIGNRAERMRQLTEELFRYSIISSQSEPEKNALERLCVNDVLEESIAAFYGEIFSLGITPGIDITETRVEAVMDKSALSRIFSNIISNMLKYSSGDLFISMNEDGLILFKNSANDLDKIAVDRLFDRFYTARTGRNSTGLGLSIAKLLAERNGCGISARIEDEKLVISLKIGQNSTKNI